MLEREIDAPLTVISGNPFFGPEGWATVAPPTIFGLRGDHNGHDVYAAALQGGSHAVRAVLATLVSRLGISPPFVRMTGGMSTSPLWCQSVSDVTQTRVKVRPLDEVAGLAGAALVVGEDVVDAASQISEVTYLPSLSESGEREAKYEAYLNLYRLASQRLNEETVTADARAR